MDRAARSTTRLTPRSPSPPPCPAACALAGYGGSLDGPFHGPLDRLLDGTLAPFRNVYKLEPVIAAVLALGLWAPPPAPGGEGGGPGVGDRKVSAADVLAVLAG